MTTWFIGQRYQKRKTFLGSAFRGTDPETERDPPAAATPIEFPLSEPRAIVQWPDKNAVPDLQTLFARVNRPTDLSRRHLEALNVANEPPCPIDDLLPIREDGSSYISPWQSEAEMTSPPSHAEAASMDESAKRRKEFTDRLKELQCDNDVAIRTITKSLKNGQKPVRLAHMRRFWEHLEAMSAYWDVSLDEYFENEWTDTDSGDSPKRAKRVCLSELDVHSARGDENGTLQHAQDCPKQDGKTSGSTGDIPLPDSPQDVDRSVYPARTHEALEAFASSDHSEEICSGPRARSQMRYKGRRTGTGRDMPDAFRSDTVKAFIEGTVWPFQASVAPPRRVPIVKINKLHVPVRQTAIISRVPKDRVKARKGIIEGPFLGVEVRAETEFHDASQANLEMRSSLDHLREIGGLLELAQERRRQFHDDKQPGEGQWWTAKPRWGGGPGGEFGDAESDGNAGIIAAVEEAVGAVKSALPSRRPRRRTPSMMWKDLKCGSGIRDAKTEYLAVGKDPSSPYDEVFMISSLNHHISILKLTVHDAYLDCLTDGHFPNPAPKESDWCCPRLQRTEWLDLFDTVQRVEAFRGLWGVMEYLTRETCTPARKADANGDEEAKDVPMTDA